MMETSSDSTRPPGPRRPKMGLLMAQILDRTTEGVLVADEDGVIVYANEPLLDLFGFDEAGLVGQSLDILLPEDHRGAHRDLVGRFVQEGADREMGCEDLDIEGRRADGSTFAIDVQLNPIPDTSLVVATVRDMTGERRTAADIAIAKIDLAQAKAQNDQLTESLDLVIQRLFALGTSVVAGAANDSAPDEILTAAVDGIDAVIATVQETRRATRR